MSRWELAGVALAVGVSAFQGTPIVRGTTVTFIAAGDASDPPRTTTPPSARACRR